MHPQTGRLGLAAEAERYIGHERFGHGGAELSAVKRRAHRFKIVAGDDGTATRQHGRLQRAFQRGDEIAKSGQAILRCPLPDMIEVHQKLQGMLTGQFRRQIVEQAPHFGLNEQILVMIHRKLSPAAMPPCKNMVKK